MAGSGYRQAPSLVRRADGQTLQLTPVLYAVLEALDGHRDIASVSLELREHRRLDIDPDDVAHLIESKLRPLGLVADPAGAAPPCRPIRPLLALRGRLRVVTPEATQRLAAPLAGLFRPPIAAMVIVAFMASSAWVLFDKGLASGTRQALYEPSLLLLVVGLTVLSAAFHELGHAAACHYGGARPGAMGAGLYIVWPAFYTDVSDSYRLDRSGRLLVDMGGLYFNAVFSVAAFALWATFGWDALLIVIPVQLLQMLRQLVPLVRFDGYHILADLTGVPDLFARVKPVLLGLLPNNWGSPEARVLKPWARAVVTLWVLVVAPLLGFSLVLVAIALPRVAATAWDSLSLHWSLVLDHWSHGQLAPTAVGFVGLFAVATPLLGMALIVWRVSSRSARRLWRAADGDSRRQAGVVMAGFALLLALGAAWWPDGQYEPIQTDDRGTLLDGVRAMAGEASALPLTLTSSAATQQSLPSMDEVREEERATTPWNVGAPFSLGGPTSSVPARRSFTPPAPPGDGDNQALAINHVDGSTLIDTSPSLVWSRDGEPVSSRNEAYALAGCHDCKTLAVAFQVVFVVGSNDAIAPENEAVAVNAGCVRCNTRSLSMQTVVTLEDEPSADELAELERIWSRVDGILAAASPATFEEIYDRLALLEAEILGVIEGAIGAPDHAIDSDEADGSTDEGGEDGTVADGPVDASSTTSTTSDGSAETGSTTSTTSSTTTTTAPESSSSTSSTSTTTAPSTGTPSSSTPSGGSPSASSTG